jgi:hypothetical protein
VYLPWRGRAKRHRIISSSTRERTRSIIVRVAIRLGTRGLEHLGVHRRPARGGRAVRAAATVLRAPESLAGALARVSVADLQLRGALLVQVRDAPGRGAETRPARAFHDHGKVVPVHQAHVVEVLTARPECELREGRRWGGSEPVALDLTGPAVAGQARPGPRSVEIAPGTAPEPTRPARGGLEGT